MFIFHPVSVSFLAILDSKLYFVCPTIIQFNFSVLHFGYEIVEYSKGIRETVFPDSVRSFRALFCSRVG